MNTKIKKIPITRSTYRHGDLKRVLLEAGITLARDGGPDAIILREATRRVGVAPNAAYRYFASRQELLEAVRDCALSSMANYMENEIAKLRKGTPDINFAYDHLRAVGTGYLKFAQSEPGLFRTAFSVADTNVVFTDHNPAHTEGSSLNPFKLLGDSLDKIVEANGLTIDDRQSAEYFVRSTIYGFAILSLDGSSALLSRKQVEALRKSLLDRIVKGL
jgi:AcrR family transcriptional regulator